MMDPDSIMDEAAAKVGYPRRLHPPGAAFLYYGRPVDDDDGTMLGFGPGGLAGVLTPVDTDPLLQTFKAPVVYDTVYGACRLLPEGRWCAANGSKSALDWPWETFARPQLRVPGYEATEDRLARVLSDAGRSTPAAS